MKPEFSLEAGFAVGAAVVVAALAEDDPVAEAESVVDGFASVAEELGSVVEGEGVSVVEDALVADEGVSVDEGEGPGEEVTVARVVWLPASEVALEKALLASEAMDE